MKFRYSSHFKRNYKSLPENIRKKFRKQANYLLSNFYYPSLRAKKYDKEEGIWQARVDKNYRFYFLIEKNAYFLLDIKLHPWELSHMGKIGIHSIFPNRENLWTGWRNLRQPVFWKIFSEIWHLSLWFVKLK